MSVIYHICSVHEYFVIKGSNIHGFAVVNNFTAVYVPAELSLKLVTLGCKQNLLWVFIFGVSFT